MHRRDPITQAPLNPGELGLPEREVPSSKNYTKAVILSGVFGFMGLQHFYLRRWGEGLLDLGLTPGAVVGAELSSMTRDSTAYRVRGSLVALRRDQARYVLVKPNGEGGTHIS